MGQIRPTVFRLVVGHTAGIAAEQLPLGPLRVGFAALFAWFHVWIEYQRRLTGGHSGRLCFQLLQHWSECLKLPDFGPQTVIQPVFDGKLKLSEQIGQEIILPRNHHLRDARALAYRLFEIATQKGWAAEALVYNELAQEWPKLEDLASTVHAPSLAANEQPSFL